MAVTDRDRAEFFKPGRQHDKAIDERKARFDGLVQFITNRNGFVTSIPGAAVVTFECLPLSTLPDELRELDYDVEAMGESQRILPHAIVEHVLVEGSSGVRQPVTHAGIARVLRYSFGL